MTNEKYYRVIAYKRFDSYPDGERLFGENLTYEEAVTLKLKAIDSLKSYTQRYKCNASVEIEEMENQ